MLYEIFSVRTAGANRLGQQRRLRPRRFRAVLKGAKHSVNMLLKLISRKKLKGETFCTQVLDGFIIDERRTRNINAEASQVFFKHSDDATDDN